MDAKAWFIAGTIPLMLGGGLHALAALLDTVRPTYFTPIDRSAMPALEGTGIRLRRILPGGGSGAEPSIWRVWLGINIGFGLGVFAVGFLCLSIANYDFSLVERIDAIRPLAIGFSAVFLVLSFRFWFYGPLLLTGSATVCFTIATVLSV